LPPYDFSYKERECLGGGWYGSSKETINIRQENAYLVIHNNNPIGFIVATKNGRVYIQGKNSQKFVKNYIKKLKTEILQSEQKVNILNDKYGQIKRKYDGLASDLLKIPAEDSYAFLDTAAYPYGGIKKFPFSDPQVKAIHRTYLEHESLIALNDNLQAQKDELSNQIKLHNKLNLDNEVAMMIMADTRTDLENINKNQEVIIAEQEKHLKKVKRKALFGKIGIGVGALIIGFLAGS